MRALDAVAGWPVERCAVRVLSSSGEVARTGDLDEVVRFASVSKPIAAWAVLVAVEEGSIGLDDPAGPPGSTVRHLLAHASGYAFEGRNPIGRPGERRIYSNTGFDVLAEHLEQASGLSFATYLSEAVLQPLGMADTALADDGSPAKDIRGTIDDAARFAAELLSPRLLAPSTVTEAITPQFPDLGGIVPGIGKFEPCPWGLGVELKGDKHPHWMGDQVSPHTYGHFGGSGTFIWVDPTIDLACVMLAAKGFDEWGMVHWPPFNNALVDEWTAGRSAGRGA